MSTIIIALVIVGSIGLILALLVYINNRDKKTDAAKKKMLHKVFHSFTKISIVKPPIHVY